MKKICLLMTVLVLAACGQGKNNTGSQDARTFGMVGDVKEVYVTRTILYTVYDDEVNEAEEHETAKMLEMSFDAKGRVTLDIYQDPYEYNTAGEFIAGYTSRTEMARDDKGRIVSYSNNYIDEEEEYDDIDFEDFFSFTYTYDAQNRPVGMELGGWEWGTEYQVEYEGDKVYPIRETYSGGYEGFVEEGVITFEYTKFDARGNWTERTSRNEMKTWEEGCEDEADTYIEVAREVRTISYWSE